jgi:endonuclease YncB( thermonuclease family)
MTLIVIAALVVALAVVWRLVRVAVRLALLAAVIGMALWYAGEHIDTGSTHGTPSTQTGRVERVTDGDTLIVSTPAGRERVRLLGIDAPEASRTRLGRPDCGGQAAARSLRHLARPGARLRLLTDSDSGDIRDRYGRLLAYAIGPQRRDLGKAQLQAGMATVYRYNGRRLSRLASYEAAQTRARATRRGVWRACLGRFHAAR